MKFKSILFVFVLALAAFSASAQEAKVKMRFGVFGENGNFFVDLKASDIRVRQNKTDLPILSLAAKTEIPLEIIIMIDASLSQESVLPDEKKAAAFLLDNVLKNGKDKAAIIRFTGEVSLVQDLTGDFGKAKGQIDKIVMTPPQGYVGKTQAGAVIVGSPLPTINDPKMAMGATSVWDSIKQVVEAVDKTPRTDARRVVVLISDGINTFGEGKLREAVAASIKAQIPVYAIGIGDDYYGGADKKTLKKLTGETGATLILPKSKLKDFPEQLKAFENNLRSTYEITFAPNAASKDAMQEIEIEIINPELRKQKLQITQPKGFFRQN
ncbi:MAG TPA: VWA domain-containing protein [Pyrinomonadaceae bacterium]|jgi:VWFA-related protein